MVTLILVEDDEEWWDSTFLLVGISSTNKIWCPLVLQKEHVMRVNDTQSATSSCLLTTLSKRFLVRVLMAIDLLNY